MDLLLTGVGGEIGSVVRSRFLKVVFVEPPSPWLVRPRAQAALGPLYLATILNEAGYSARIFHPVRPSSCECLKDVDVVAFSGTTLEYPEVVRYAKWIKKHLPNVKIWYGGPHATALPAWWRPWCDSIGIGEADGYIKEADNVVRMERYVEATGKCNWG